MVALISKSNIELELQATLPAAFTTEVIEDYSDEAEDNVKFETSRSTFTGPSASAYKRAVLLSICMRVGSSVPTLLRSNISSISEQGDSISFRSGDGYRTEYNQLIRRLALKPVTSAVSVATNDETFYSSATEEEE